MKIAVKVVAVILTFIFFGGCFVIGSQKEEAAYEAQLEQQEHDLQAARMGRVSAFGPEAVGEK